MIPENENEYLSLCRKMVEEKLGWNPVGEWRNYEFTELSDRILDSTGVQLSTTTLKRVFGKLKYDNLPSSVTLNALATYLGFKSWMDLKSNSRVIQTQVKPDNLVPAAEKKFLIRKLLAAGALLTVVLISAFSFIVLSKDPAILPENISFSSRPLAAGLPNSVVFKIEPNELTGKVLIQQSWDSTKTIQLSPGQKEATGIYYVPGYFRAKLIANGRILKEHDLFIRSDNWMATIDHEPIPRYIKKEELETNGSMSVSPSVIKEIRTSTIPLTLTYHLVRPFKDLHSNNYTLETSLQNTYSEGPAICKTVKIYVLCTRGAFIIPFTIPGCVSNINLKLGDKLFEGRANDLSAFGTDPSEKLNIKLVVKNRQVDIFLEGKLIRSEKYDLDAGSIVGLRYSFMGAGSVNAVRLLDHKGGLAYEEGFNK